MAKIVTVYCYVYLGKEQPVIYCFEPENELCTSNNALQMYN